MIKLGAHIPAADPLAAAEERGAEIVQFFVGNPKGWKKPLPRRDAEQLRSSPVDVYVHAPYLVNVVSPNNRVRIPSRKNLAQTVEAAEQIGAAGVIVHGGHAAAGEAVEDGFPRWRKALEQLDAVVPILIENTASGNRAPARRIDHLAGLWEVIGGLDPAPGFCLDTCHAWAGGEPLEGLVERVLEATGRIDLVHLNDSRDGFDSRRDRHANLGRGRIPGDLLAEVVAEAGAPTLVETPGGAAEHLADLAWIRGRLPAPMMSEAGNLPAGSRTGPPA